MTTKPHPFKAERTDILVGLESEQKEEATPSRYPGLMKDGQELADPEIEWIEERVVGGNRDVYQHVEGPKTFDGGSWTVVPYDGWPIAFALGAEEDGSIVRKQDGPPPTATVEGIYYGHDGQDDFARALVGVTCDSATIEVNNEEELQVSLSTIALGLTDDTYDGSRTPTSAPDLPDVEPWSFRRTSSNLTIFGTEFARVEDFSLEMTNNLTPERYIESDEAAKGEPYEVTYGNGEYSLNLEIAITDGSLYQELINPTEGGFDMSIEFDNGDGDVLSIEGSGLRMESTPHGVPDDGKVTVSPSITPRTVWVDAPGSFLDD